MLTLRMLATLILCLLAFPARAADAESHQVITAPEVKNRLENVPGTLLIHSLSEIEYRIQHISGSINIPVTEMENTHLLPADKTQNLIFYCMGDKCAYSERACGKATALGYQNVFWFRGGIPEWRRFGYPLEEDDSLKNIPVNKLSPSEVHTLAKDPEVILLDVRPLWWKDLPRALENSQFMPLVELQNGYVRLPREKKFILVDGYMKQSPSAAKYLTTKGYRVLGILKGGIGRWEKEAYPTVPKTPEEP